MAMDIDTECMLIAAPDVAQTLLENEDKDDKLKGVSGALCIAMFAPPGTCMMVRFEDWKRMIENGDVYERKHEESGDKAGE